MPRSKGKGKAVATENASESAPLLGSPSRSYQTLPVSSEDQPIQRHRVVSRIGSIVYTILIIWATLIIGFLLFLVLLAASYKPSPSELSSLPRTAFAYSPPDSISVLNITDDGLLLNISIRCGIDADRAFGVKEFDNPQEKAEAEERGERGLGAAWWEHLRRWTAHKALSKLQDPTVSVYIPDSIQISAPHFKSSSLMSVSIQDELQIPLIWNINPQPPNTDPEWLQPLSFTALAKPVASTGELWEYVQRGWAQGEVKVTIDINRVEARPSDNAWWTKYAMVEKEQLTMEIASPIPHIPRLPNPGHPLNLSQLVTLQHYSFDTNRSPEALTVRAVATVPNFAPDFNTTLDFSLPFSISLPPLQNTSFGENKMAEVITEPVLIGGPGENIELRLSGVITADLSERSQLSIASKSSPLSLFLQNYLHGRDNPIIVRGLAALPSFAPPLTPQPPFWLLHTLPSLSLSLNFPGPKPPPKIIQSVTIDHMRISENGGKMKASGTVIAQVELPHDMQNVDVDVIEVQPDVLVFDGPAPEDGGEGDEGDLPPRAFGHIRPEDFLDSITSPSGDPNYPHRLIVSAPLRNVDLDILPGRDAILSEFVSKVVFKGGALAGVRGIASVGVKIKGVDGKVRLDNLPVRGEFWVGKQRFGQ
ncbi:uncharacterized protein IL334_000418 [Kwoniella shivajii]|uniref:Pre-rRNA processing protein n=1 Tax=Kwoniella shivajii TaxID=564305 RepID=A0ABZ1CPA6_9TREE|nr:hypothetical protein IL334_000418 [Kwoniella shivajii]